MLERTGVPVKEQLDRVQPPPGHEGPMAVIECFQEIPCNPCSEACTRGAIASFTDINNPPVLIREKCNGCGNCMFRCPGLAIFVIDESYSDTETLVKIPYEYLPLPEEGTPVTALDREGKPVGLARVIKVQQGKAMDRTAIIWLAVPKGLGMTVRSIQVGR
ncbi:MAG: 4Fe-4S binding protein [Clostridia bacterium]|nr:4Fe-4S binding protein [Clostridia bacterium]